MLAGVLVAAGIATAREPAVLISEYGEGSSYNKFIEIYNGSQTNQNLADFRIWVISNSSDPAGNPWPGNEITLSGTLATGDVYVVCHPSADTAIRTNANLETSKLNHNGNDAIGLAWTNSGSGWELIDSVGRANDNPGLESGWDVAGTNEATFNHTLIRKGSAPNTNWTESAGSSTNDSEWIVMPQDTFSYLGYHEVIAQETSYIIPDPTSVWINEIHYDNDSADTNEGVEVAGRAGLSLNQYEIILYSESGGEGSVYGTATALTGLTIDNEDRGFGAVWIAYPQNGLQNDTEGIALIRVNGTSTQIVQFVSYEGSFIAIDGPAKGYTSEDIGISEGRSTPSGLSLQLTGTGNSYRDFTWAGPASATRGSINTNQTYKPMPFMFFVN